MATKVERTPTGFMVSQLVGPTRRKRIWRTPVLVPYGDMDMLRIEILKQAEESRSIALPGGLK